MVIVPSITKAQVGNIIYFLGKKIISFLQLLFIVND